MTLSSPWVQNIVTGTLLVCAIAVAISVVHREFFSSPNAATSGKHIKDWQPLTTSRSPVLGSTSAPLKIVEFSDYQCPFCRDLDVKLREENALHPGSFALVRYDLPLTNIHPDAYRAAMASRCALAQGIAEPFEAAIFDSNEDMKNIDWQAMAKRTGVPNIDNFNTCLKEQSTASLVQADIKEAHKLGFSDETPILIVRGNVIKGTMDQDALNDLIVQNSKQ